MLENLKGNIISNIEYADHHNYNNNDVIKIDTFISTVVGIKPDLNRISRADGKNDARKD